MSSQSGAKARHRASSSRVVPAIPLALEARSRRSLEQSKIPKDASGSETTKNASKPTDDLPPPSASQEASDIVTNEVAESFQDPAQAGSESSQPTEATLSGQTNGLTSTTTTPDPQSAVSVSCPSAIPMRQSEANVPTPRPIFGPRSESPPPASAPNAADQVLPAPRTLTGPHPGAAPFIPNGHSRQTSEIQAAYPNHVPHISGGIIADPTPRGSSDGSFHAEQRSVASDVEPAAANAFNPRPTQAFPTMKPPPVQDSVATHIHQPMSAIHPALANGVQSTGRQESYPPPPGLPSNPHISFHRPSPSTITAMSSFDPAVSYPTALHLHEQFGSAELADYVVRLTHSHSLFPPLAFPAHAIVLAQCPRLYNLMRHYRMGLTSATGLKELPVQTSDRFLVNHQAFIKALARLYGGSLPDPRFVTTAIGLRTMDDYMRFALSYAAAGHLLELDEIVNRGVGLINDFMSPETLELALCFGLDGGIGSRWLPRDRARESLSENNSSAANMSDRSSQPEESLPNPTYGIYSDQTLEHILGFMTRCIGSHFVFDATAPQLMLCSRLPFDNERRHARSSSRLTQIRFGEMQSNEDVTSDPLSKLLSSVLVSLPFSLLKHFLDHGALLVQLGPQSVTDLATQVINERELRRNAAAEKAFHVAPTTVSERKMFQNLRWEERVDHGPELRGGRKISRRYIGE